MAYKFFIRELLGLAIVVSVVFGVLGVILDLFALTALWEHQDAIAQIFFHESFYFIAFLIPPFFLWKLINRSDLVTAAQNYIALKLEAESR
ncbi:D-fructose-6-phosphate amidotransferase [Vibrio parahaemolyticus]|nr:D-fructose-6-phosphate amidotransferase [Vibrio parahaemolyticus]MBM5029431.1 D-fructose-6-phosphate amidotransferase [Vibrio parahaemolyticus]